MKKMMRDCDARSRLTMTGWWMVVVVVAFVVLCTKIEASTRVTAGSGSWSSLGVLPSDTLYIRSAHAVTVNVNDAGLSCVAIIDSGKLIRPGGTRLNVGAIRITSGGVDSVLNGVVGPILQVSNDDRLGADDYSVLPGGKLYTNNRDTTARWRIIGTTTNGTLPSFMNNGAASIVVRGGWVQGFQNSWPNAGWTFINSNRVVVEKTRFDSASVSFQNTGGHLFRGNQITTYAGMNRALIVRNSTADTVMGCRIRHNSLGGGGYAGAQGIYVASNNTVIWACNIKDTNFTGSWGGDYGIALEQGYSGTKCMFDTLSGFEFTLASPAGNHPNLFVYRSKIANGAHESVILHNGDTGWKIYGSLITSFVSGGRSSLTVYCSSSGGADGLELLYNTIVACYGGAPASSAIAFENIGGGNITYGNIKMVGNILIGDNAGFSRAEIVLGTTASQTVTVNFTEFKRNAFDSVYYFGSSGATYPYNRLDSNLHNATGFVFVDSTGGDFRLGAGSPMKNAGDSAYGCVVYGDFRAATKPFNIGFDQNFYSRWDYQKHSWIRTAQMCYGATTNGNFLGRTTDVLVNGDAISTIARQVDSMVKVIDYNTMSSCRSKDYGSGIPTFISKYDPGRTVADFTINVTGSAVTTSGQQNVCEGDLEVSNPGSPLTFCGWSETNRRIFKYANAWTQKYLKYQFLTNGNRAEGIMEDEPSTFNGAFCCNQPTGMYGMLFPFFNGDITPGTWMNNVGYAGMTYQQIWTAERALRKQYMKGVLDTMNLFGFKHFGNVTNYSLVSFDPYINGQPSSARDMSDNWELIRDFGAGALVWENALTPSHVYGYWEAQCWQAMDSVAVWDTGQIIVWLTIMPNDSITVANAQGGWARCQMQRLAFYYMASSRKSIFMISSNMGGSGPLKPNDFIGADTVFKYVKAVERDVGQPTGARFIATSGTDPAGQAYTLWRRNFQNAIMLYREAVGTPGNPGTVNQTSAISYNLGVTATQLNADNTLGAVGSSALIRNMEGQIWLLAAGPSNPTISLSGCTTSEGGYCTMSANLSQAIAHDVRVTFNTTSGTATAGLDFTGQTNQIYTIPAGSTSVSIPVATLTDQLADGTETYLGTISSVQVVGGSEVIDQGAMSANGYIDDVPPQQQGGPSLLWRGVMPN